MAVKDDPINAFKALALSDVKPVSTELKQMRQSEQEVLNLLEKTATAVKHYPKFRHELYSNWQLEIKIFSRLFGSC